MALMMLNYLSLCKAVEHEKSAWLQGFLTFLSNHADVPKSGVDGIRTHNKSPIDGLVDSFLKFVPNFVPKIIIHSPASVLHVV